MGSSLGCISLQGIVRSRIPIRRLGFDSAQQRRQQGLLGVQAVFGLIEDAA